MGTATASNSATTTQTSATITQPVDLGRSLQAKVSGIWADAQLVGMRQHGVGGKNYVVEVNSPYCAGWSVYTVAAEDLRNKLC